MGTDQGTIRMYLWPFDPLVKEPEFFEVSVHQEAVVQLKITYDMCFLLSGGADGSMYVLSLQEIINGIEVTNAIMMMQSNSNSPTNRGKSSNLIKSSQQ